MPDEKICPLLTIAVASLNANREIQNFSSKTCSQEKCAWWIEGHAQSDIPIYRDGACAIKKIPLWMPES